MFNMHKKVSAKERVVGFYSTGPSIRPADLHVDALFRQRKYSHTPLLVIVDVRPDVQGLPVQAYASHDALSETMEASRVFSHITCEVRGERGCRRYLHQSSSRTPCVIHEDTPPILQRIICIHPPRPFLPSGGRLRGRGGGRGAPAARHQ